VSSGYKVNLREIEELVFFFKYAPVYWCTKRVIKSGRMRWVGHTVRMEEIRIVYTILVGKPEGKRPRVDGKIILQRISGK
jgi:hypothetical protein